MSYTRAPRTASKNECGTVKVGAHLHASTDGEISVDVDSIVGQGQWVPRLINGPDGGGIAIKINCANYVKSGSLVHALFDIQITDIGKGNKFSYVMLEGLPFISAKTDGYCGSLLVSYFANLDFGATSLTGSVLSNSYACDIWCSRKNVATLEKLDYSDIKKSTRIQGTVIYTAQ